MDSTDIFISGGGIAGLAAGLLLAEAGRSVTVADPAPPAPDGSDAASDLRSTAFLQPARAVFECAGLWSALEPHATPLETLRVIDTSGWPPQERARREFHAGDLDLPAFGWNLPNWLTRRELVRLAGERLDLRLGAGFRSLLVRDREAIVGLTGGQRLTARLVVGADGRDSPVREASGIGARTTRYGQKALAFVVSHPEPHRNISTEIYNAGGAFTLVPLPDVDGRPASAVVWMNDGPRAAALAAMPPDEIAEVATTRSGALLGSLTLESQVRLWPVITRLAQALTAPRTALIAEAAHVMPPIGAQGLNTSLNDVAALARALSGAADPGSEPVLHDYARARETDIRARAAAIDLFNRICRSGGAPVQALRRSGLLAVHDLPVVRRGVMRRGMGEGRSAGPAQPGGGSPGNGEEAT